MAISIIILVISSALFLYWFRYACVLILRTRDARKYAQQVAEINHLSFVNAQEQLASTPPMDGTYARLHAALDRDYRVVSYLLRHAGTHGGHTVEEYLLRLDFQLMRVCYHVAKPFSAQSARRALIQQASIISHLANRMGERLAL